ncbi:hypothetical protein L1887_11427 [Cichorium endivia]|nr:hypothetical protein L1887_11427 [Cichorium endivia]
MKRVKEHLACTHKDVVPCPKVPDEVKAEMIEYLKTFQNNKFSAQRNFEENVGSGAYYSSGWGSVNLSQVNTDSYQTGNTRGFRGPMDRFVASARDGEEGLPGENMTSTNAKEHRNQVCMDIGRFFYENGIPFNIATSPSFTTELIEVNSDGEDDDEDDMLMRI